MADNKSLTAAAKAKKDEFYTQRGDIENELQWYWDDFTGKTIFCNCDDPFESQFFFYFAAKFNDLNLKKLIAISYVGSPIAYDLFAPVDNPAKPAYKVEINEIKTFGEDNFNWDDVTTMMNELKAALGNKNSATVGKNTLTILKDDLNYCAGDFRSADSIRCLREADVVVTNPPFSLFREYVAQLMQYRKKFLIIGNINCITYKEIFPLIKNNKVWLGHGMGRAISGFIVPKTYELYGTEARIENGKRIVATNQCLWLTNLEHEKHNKPYDLVFSYEKDPSHYPKYDNYDAIEVSKTGEIPYDYNGVMGVPITFLDKYCPEQFEILGHTSSNDLSPEVEALRTDAKNRNRGIINGKQKYDRILIRRRDL